MSPDIEIPNLGTDEDTPDVFHDARAKAAELFRENLERALETLMSETSHTKVLKALRSRKSRKPQPTFGSIVGGVYGEEADGSYSAAFETEHGRMVLQDAKRIDRPEDPQAIAITPSEGAGPPGYLRELDTVLEDSRRILDLREDWDDDGASAIAERTWERATGFLKRQAERLWSEASRLLPVPGILPVPNGSIDLHWETDEYELLINIPNDPNKPASFYGDNYGEIQIRGTLDPDREHPGVLSWLTPQ